MTLVTTLAGTAIRPAPDFNRLLAVLRRESRPDRVPAYELFANPEIMEAVLGKAVPDRAATVEFYYRLGYDYVPAWPHVELRTGSLIDTSSDYPIKDWRTFEAYPWPEPASISFAEFEAVNAALPEGMAIVGQTGGIFEMAQSLCGYAGLCLLLHDERELVRAIFARLGALYEAMYAGMATMPGVGAVVISDDMGFRTQTLIAPADLRELVLPWHRRLAAIAHAHGKPVILHSCGQLAAVMEDIIADVRIDAKHSFEDTILPVEQAKRLYGERIALLGGFDVDRLCRSSEEEIRAHVRFLLETCGASGGYALGSGNSIAAFVPVPNYLTMMDEWWRITGGLR